MNWGDAAPLPLIPNSVECGNCLNRVQRPPLAGQHPPHILVCDVCKGTLWRTVRSPDLRLWQIPL